MLAAAAFYLAPSLVNGAVVTTLFGSAGSVTAFLAPLSIATGASGLTAAATAVAASGFTAAAGAIITGIATKTVARASNKKSPLSAQASPKTNENEKATTKAKIIFIGSGVMTGAAAVYYFCCATAAAPVAAPAIGTIAFGAGIGAAVSAAVATAVPGFMGFTPGGIASSSIAAWLMSVSAVANGGGVAAGGVVATMQSIGVLGLGAPAIFVIGGVGAFVIGAGLAQWASKKAVVAATTTIATRLWTSPVVRVGTGAVTGAVVGWLVFVLVGDKIIYHFFGEERAVRQNE